MTVKSQIWTTPGTYTWTRPTGVGAGLLTMLAGGSGGDGYSSGGVSGCGCFNVMVPVSSNITVVVGSGGTGAEYPGGLGGESSFGIYKVLPYGVGSGNSKWYVTPGYADFRVGIKESCLFFGGSFGGYATGDVENSYSIAGGGSGGHLIGGAPGGDGFLPDYGGGGGGTQVFGGAGDGGALPDPTTHSGSDATAAGAGGGGGSYTDTGGSVGGDGYAGYVAFIWFE